MIKLRRKEECFSWEVAAVVILCEIRDSYGRCNTSFFEAGKTQQVFGA